MSIFDTFLAFLCVLYGNRLPEKSNKKSRKTGKFLARATGLEPVTYGLTGVTKNGVKKSAVIGRNLRVSED